MTDFSIPDPTPPSPAQMLAKMLLQHALTGLSTLLAAWGVIDKDQTSSFVVLALAVCMFSGNAIWGVLRVYAIRNHWFDALNAPVPKP